MEVNNSTPKSPYQLTEKGQKVYLDFLEFLKSDKPIRLDVSGTHHIKVVCMNRDRVKKKDNRVLEVSH